MCSIHSNQKYFCTFCLEKSEVIGHYTLNCPKSVCKECGVNGYLKKERPKSLFMDEFHKSLQMAKKETYPIKEKVILESDVNFEYKAKLKPKFNTHYHTKTLPSLSWKTGRKPKNDRSHGIFGQRRFDMEKIKKHSELFSETNHEQFDYANKTKSHGFGEKMLKKMGWSEGDGLGRTRSGEVYPSMFGIGKKRFKNDLDQGLPKVLMDTLMHMARKHPVTGLIEITTKLLWEEPKFVQVLECELVHKKKYIFKVVVNGNEYQPTIASGPKKEARANAATFALQEMGFLKKDPNNPL